MTEAGLTARVNCAFGACAAIYYRERSEPLPSLICHPSSITLRRARNAGRSVIDYRCE